MNGAFPQLGGLVTNTIKIVQKGWGYERWFVNGAYCGKELFFFRGKKCSFHYHRIKDETFFITEGRFGIWAAVPFEMLNWWADPKLRDQAESVAGGWLTEEPHFILTPGDTFYVPPGQIHQMKALDADSRLIEFSTHHEDEDSFRVTKGD